MNKVILIGNLTRDPEMHTTPSGVVVAQLGLAVSRRYAGKDGQRETDFFNVVAWRQNADFASKYLHKGNRVAIEGSIQMRQYTDKSGANRTVYEIIADNIDNLTPRAQGEQPPATGTAQTGGNAFAASAFTEVPANEADLPL